MKFKITKNYFRDKTLLITGGTGSFGKKFLEVLLQKKIQLKKIIIFSRDELKQYEMAKNLKYKCNNVRFFIGDVRDKERLKRAFSGVDFLVHAAALKQVPTAEYNPIEFVKTNTIGAYNIVEAAIDCNVKKIISLSTDKACAPINLYGATKLCSDKLFIAANSYSGTKNIFSVVRYGNVMNSRGSVVPFFLSKFKNNDHMPVTDLSMTRFSISLEEGANFVLNSLEFSRGTEILIPKIPSYRIKDLIKAISNKPKIRIIGIRPGEKVHEEMITSSDSLNTLDCNGFYVILPSLNTEISKYYKISFSAKKVPNNFLYRSDLNNQFMSINDLKKLIFKL